MRVFSKKNLLDEMQEQKLQKIESKGFWGAWAALLAAFVIQSAMGRPAEQWRAEWIIFMGMNFYGVAACLIDGIWERHLVAGGATNVVCSVAAGGAVALLTWVNEAYLPGALICGGFTAVLCFVCLQAGVSLYKKRRDRLDREDPEDAEK